MMSHSGRYSLNRTNNETYPAMVSDGDGRGCNNDNSSGGGNINISSQRNQPNQNEKRASEHEFEREQSRGQCRREHSRQSTNAVQPFRKGRKRPGRGAALRAGARAGLRRLRHGGVDQSPPGALPTILAAHKAR